MTSYRTAELADFLYSWKINQFHNTQLEYVYNHNYNIILESDWFLARPIFYQNGACAAKVSNSSVQ